MNQPDIDQLKQFAGYLEGRGYISIASDMRRLCAEVERLRQGLWDCFAAAGGDTDGDKTPRALVSDIVPLAVESVKDLMRDYM